MRFCFCSTCCSQDLWRFLTINLMLECNVWYFPLQLIISSIPFKRKKNQLLKREVEIRNGTPGEDTGAWWVMKTLTVTILIEQQKMEGVMEEGEDCTTTWGLSKLPFIYPEQTNKHKGLHIVRKHYAGPPGHLYFHTGCVSRERKHNFVFVTSVFSYHVNVVDSSVMF